MCRDYWFPVYAFVRRHGHGHHDGQDLTQGFFALILERGGLGKVQPGLGKFRSYLLAAAKNFMAKEHRKEHALKRGGEAVLVSIDGDDFDGRFQLETADGDTPETLYHRSWASTLLGRAMARLEKEYDQAGKGKLFEVLGARLAEPKGTVSNDDAAARLDMTSGAVAVALHRMRARYKELLRREVKGTLADGESENDIDQEIQQLLASLH